MMKSTGVVPTGVVRLSRLVIGLGVVAVLASWALRSEAGVPTTTLPPRCGDGKVTPPETCDPPGSVQANGNVCRKDCTFCGDKIINDGEQCEPPNTSTCSSTCTSCPGSPCANPRLGAASGCTLFQLGGNRIGMSGPPGVDGDVCVGPQGSLDISGDQRITGTLRLAAGATFQRSGTVTIGNVVTGADLSAAVNAAISASSTAAGLACTQTPTLISSGGATAITGNGGVNVICVQDVHLSGGSTVTFSGGPSDSFVVNVQGHFQLDGNSKFLVGGSTQPRDVLFNLLGSGAGSELSGNSVVNGTMLAVNHPIQLSGGVVNGAVISGGQIQMSSGARVLCPSSAVCTPSSTPGSCATPFLIPAAGGSFSGTTSGTSAQSGTCAAAATAGAPEQVFQWTPSKSGTATIQTCGAGTKFDTVLYVHSGSCNKGSEVACDDDACASGDVPCGDQMHASKVTVNVTAQQTYFIFVDGFAGSCGNSSGDFILTVTGP